ncbi:MAG: FAD-dependent monooxygenase, partial [Anaerolineae bacterium]|nr:FAD-dependent monooxygenase [Anaerolineae bacterium]
MSNEDQPRQLISRRTFLATGATALGVLAAVGFGFRQYIERFLNSLNARQPQVQGFDSLDDTLYDVVIVGSGPAGAILGRELVNKGLKTLILEAGPSLSNPDSSIQAHRLEVVRNSGSIDYPISSTRLRAVGGTSLIWTGRSPRLHPIDFENNAYTPEGADWPFRYEDIERYYEQAERTLRVRGDALSEMHAPRNSPLPLHTWFTEGIGEVQEVMQPVNLTWDFSPTSTGIANHNAGLQAMTDVLPDFTDSPHGTLVVGAALTNIVPDDAGNVASLEVSNYTGQVRNVRGERYVIACGGIDSAKLLLQSRSDVYPNGFGNDNDMVGRFFNEHYNITLQGQLPTDKLPSENQLARSHSLYKSFKEEGLGSIILWSRVQPDGVVMVGATLEIYPHPDNRVTLAEDMPDGLGNPGMDLSFSFTEKDERTKEAVYALLEQILVDIGATDIEETIVHQWAHHHY